MRPVVVVCALGTLALSVGAESGQAISQRTDPQAGSPAGVIYQIPLDTGRRDAAPVLHIRGRHSASSAGANSSGENGRGEAGHSAASNGGGFGGGGGVGGGEADGAAGSEAGSAAPGGGIPNNPSSSAASGGGTPNNPSSIHSENGFGSSSQVPGVSPAALRTGAGVPSAQTPSSTLPTYLLMALIGLAAVAVGLITARGTRGIPGSQGISK